MENRILKIEKTCPYCGKVQTVEVPEKDYLEWKRGKLLHKAMPTLKPEERETLLSGICSDCWDELFQEPDI